MTILSVIMVQQHHAKAVEQYFLFLHTPIIYKPYITSINLGKSITQPYMHQ